MTFSPKVAYITGGGTGIGKALAEAFHKRGIQVVIGGRRAHKLEVNLVHLAHGRLMKMPQTSVLASASTLRQVAAHLTADDCHLLRLIGCLHCVTCLQTPALTVLTPSSGSTPEPASVCA